MLIKIKSDEEKVREEQLLRDFRKPKNKENLEIVEFISAKMKDVTNALNRFDKHNS